MTSEAERMERLAERLRVVNPAVASPAAKVRGWNLVLSEVQRSAARTRPRTFPRVVLAVVVVVVLALAVVVTSADSLPDSPLYPVKGLVENIRGALALSPSDQFNFHLDLAMTRLREGEAMIASHRVDLADQALGALDDQINSAALLVQSVQRTGPLAAVGLRSQLQQAVASDDRELAGLQGQVTDPAAIAAIKRARDRAQRAVLTASPSPSPTPSP